MRRDDPARARAVARQAFYEIAQDPSAALSQYERLLQLLRPDSWLLQERRLHRIGIASARALAYNELARQVAAMGMDDPVSEGPSKGERRVFEREEKALDQWLGRAVRGRDRIVVGANRAKRARRARASAESPPRPAPEGGARAAIRSEPSTRPRINDPALDDAPESVQRARRAIKSLMPHLTGMHAKLRAARTNADRAEILRRMEPLVAQRARHWITVDEWFETMHPAKAEGPEDSARV